MAEDPYDLSKGRDPYDLSKGGDPHDLSKGGDPYDLSKGGDPHDLSRSGSAHGYSSQSGSASSSESGPSGKTTSEGLPQFNNKKTYLVSGRSLNAIVQAIQANRVRVVQGGGLKIVSVSDQGTFLAVDGVDCP